LRYLVLREAKNTGQLMAALVTTSQTELAAQEFTEMMRALPLKARLVSLYHVVSDTWSDAVVMEQKRLLFGQANLVETLGEFSFNLGPDTFFQVNPKGVSELYAQIRTKAALTKEERVLDLFCGVGSIGIFLASQAKYVWGVELEPAIIACAWQNAKDNRVDNISFFTGDARKFLNAEGSFYKGVDLLVLNPPRSGISAKMLRAITRLEPKRVIYSSCNPKTLFADLDLIRQEYKLESVEPFDFFPHTPHVECLTVLSRKV